MSSSDPEPEEPGAPGHPGSNGTGSDHAIGIHLDELLAARGMTLTELADRAGITIANLSILKNGRARAIRFSTLTKLCEILRCQPGDLISYSPRTTAPVPPAR
jgi:putative transcriptional regulator